MSKRVRRYRVLSDEGVARLSEADLLPTDFPGIGHSVRCDAGRTACPSLATRFCPTCVEHFCAQHSKLGVCRNLHELTVPVWAGAHHIAIVSLRFANEFGNGTWRPAPREQPRLKSDTALVALMKGGPYDGQTLAVEPCWRLNVSRPRLFARPIEFIYRWESLEPPVMVVDTVIDREDS